MAKYKLPTTKELFESGVHYGHQVRRWNPRMAPFIYTASKNIHIINLEKTLDGLKAACEFLYETAKKGGKIVFVGTKKQAAELTAHEAQRCGALFVNERWLGGTLTNNSVIRQRIEKLVNLKAKRSAGELSKYTKKEQLLIDREIEKLEKVVGGLVGLKGIPAAIFVVDTKREKTAVREAVKKSVPVVALVDTNSSPTGIDHIIPGNDDAIKSLVLILRTVADAVEAGYKDYADSAKDEESAKK